MKIRHFAMAFALATLVWGCGNPEARQVLKMLSERPEIVNRDVHVKKVTFTEKHQGGTMAFEADILNKDGNVVGKATGRRIEGFASTDPRFEWTDPALADKTKDGRPDANKAMKEKLMTADRDGDGKVSYEEALTVVPHLSNMAFKYFDKNEDGFISPDDDKVQDRPRKRGPWGGRRGQGRRGAGGAPAQGAPQGQPPN